LNVGRKRGRVSNEPYSKNNAKQDIDSSKDFWRIHDKRFLLYRAMFFNMAFVDKKENQRSDCS
jgi:hypothetical protein